jgi:hypothetical protein
MLEATAEAVPFSIFAGRPVFKLSAEAGATLGRLVPAWCQLRASDMRSMLGIVAEMPEPWATG